MTDMDSIARICHLQSGTMGPDPSFRNIPWRDCGHALVGPRRFPRGSSTRLGWLSPIKETRHRQQTVGYVYGGPRVRLECVLAHPQ